MGGAKAKAENAQLTEAMEALRKQAFPLHPSPPPRTRTPYNLTSMPYTLHPRIPNIFTPKPQKFTEAMAALRKHFLAFPQTFHPKP